MWFADGASDGLRAVKGRHAIVPGGAPAMVCPSKDQKPILEKATAKNHPHGEVGNHVCQFSLAVADLDHKCTKGPRSAVTVLPGGWRHRSLVGNLLLSPLGRALHMSAPNHLSGHAERLGK